MRTFSLKHLHAQFPTRKTKYSAGYDVYSCDSVHIAPKSTAIIPTGIAICMEKGEWAGVYLRSSVGLRSGLIMPNGVGVIDADYYPNTVGVIVYNTTNESIVVNRGERLAQIIFHEYKTIHNEVEILDERVGGIGSTNK